MVAGFAAAYMRAAATISSSGIQVISATFEGGYSCTRSARASKPYVQFSTNSWSYRSSLMMTFMKPSARAASVPGRTRSHFSERPAIQVSCGSMVMTFVPRFMASMIQWPWKASELLIIGLTPHMMATSGISYSGSAS